MIFASRFGMPVSTTHVSVGSITGIGIVGVRDDTTLVIKKLDEDYFVEA